MRSDYRTSSAGSVVEVMAVIDRPLVFPSLILPVLVGCVTGFVTRCVFGVASVSRGVTLVSCRPKEKETHIERFEQSQIAIVIECNTYN